MQTQRKVTVADIYPFALIQPQIDSDSDLDKSANKEEDLFKLKEDTVKTLVAGFGLIL